MRHNVTTPGGFFIGLGGIAAFCAASVGVAWWVTTSGPTDDLYEARLATGLAVAKDAPVGFGQITLTFTIVTPTPDKLPKLLELTDRYCVVAQTLSKSAPIKLVLSSAAG